MTNPYLLYDIYVRMALGEIISFVFLPLLFYGLYNIIYQDKKVTIRRIIDEKNSMNYIFLSATLDNGNVLYIRIQVASIQESVQISNRLLILIGGVSVLIASVLASFISRRFMTSIRITISKIAS